MERLKSMGPLFIAIGLVIMVSVWSVVLQPAEPREYSDLTEVSMEITYTDSSVDTIVVEHNMVWPIELKLGDLKVTRYSVNKNTLTVPMYTVKSGVRDYKILNIR